MTARLLPKTLFGERFVALEMPEDPSAERLADGDVIGQDRSENAIELQRVVDDLLPLLQAVRAARTSPTRSARSPTRCADAATAWAPTWPRSAATSGEINTVLPELQADISGLADFADTYESAADDLLAVLDNLAVTSRTLVDQQRAAPPHLHRGRARRHGHRRVPRDERAEPHLAGRDVPSGARHSSPSTRRSTPASSTGWPAPSRGIGETFGGDGDPALNLNIIVTLPPRNPYVPGDQPEYLDQSGAGLPGPGRHRRDHRRGRRAGRVLLPLPRPTDGVDSRDNPLSGNPVCLGGSGRDDVPAGRRRAQPRAGTSLPGGLAGSTAELDFVRSILAYQTGAEPGDVSDLARLAAGAAAAGHAGDAPMKGRWGPRRPLVKLVAFALVTILASYVLITTITNAGYGEQVAYRAEFTDVAGLVEGDEVRIAGVRVGQVTGIGLAEATDRPVAEVELEVDAGRAAARRRRGDDPLPQPRRPALHRARRGRGRRGPDPRPGRVIPLAADHAGAGPDHRCSAASSRCCRRSRRRT